MRRLLFILGLPLALCLTLAAGLKDDYFEMSKQLESCSLRFMVLFYVDELAPGELMETGIKAMYPSSTPRYFPESKMEDVRFMQTGNEALGRALKQEGETIVVDMLEEQPLKRLGCNLAMWSQAWTGGLWMAWRKTKLVTYWKRHWNNCATMKRPE